MSESDDSRVGLAVTKPLSERLEALLREHRETMAADVLMSWARDALVEMSEAAALARRVEGAEDGKVIALARNAWQEGGEARMLANDMAGPVGGKYLRNRLEVAFIAGYDAAVKRLVPEVGS